jgi:hypothetical protein
VKPCSLISGRHAQESGGTYSSPLHGMTPYWHVPRTQEFAFQPQSSSLTNSTPMSPRTRNFSVALLR